MNVLLPTIASPADLHLRLDDDRVADLVGSDQRVLHRCHRQALRDLQSVTGEQLLALVLQQIHCGAGL